MIGGDGIPEVILAGEVEKYYQENYLLRFDSETHQLNLVASAMDEPKRVGRYVRLYFNSGRRAIFEEWEFLKWKHDDLISVASWHDEVGYGTMDSTFSEGTRTIQNGKTQTINIGYGKGADIETDAYELNRDGEPFGKMRVIWTNAEDRYRTNADEIEKAWLFEKTTGLPRQLYPPHEGSKVIPLLDDFATVTVDGNTEAANLFSVKKK